MFFEREGGYVAVCWRWIRSPSLSYRIRLKRRQLNLERPHKISRSNVRALPPFSLTSPPATTSFAVVVLLLDNIPAHRSIHPPKAQNRVLAAANDDLCEVQITWPWFTFLFADVAHFVPRAITRPQHRRKTTPITFSARAEDVFQDV